MSARDVIHGALVANGWRAFADPTTDAVLTALTAAGYVVEQGWQDIATCPDGVGDALFAWWDAEFSSWIIERCAGWASSDRSEHQTAVEVAMEIGCTMWRPLPAPPAQEPQP